MMERMFSISQVAQMLGLGIDAVRFYEKKGLVHPQVNSKNRYRMYSFYQLWSCWTSVITEVWD